MRKRIRKFAEDTRLMGRATLRAVGLATHKFGLVVFIGLTILFGAVGPINVAYADEPASIEIKEMNAKSEFHITQIYENNNTVTVAWDSSDAAWNPAEREFQLTDYHIFWGDVSDEELPEMWHRTDGVTTVVYGSDGDTRFNWPYQQEAFTLPEGVKLVDNTQKILTYVVKITARRPGLQDKIIAGRIDYSKCINSIGYSIEGASCGRDEYANGKSFYNAYTVPGWQKLEPAAEIEYVDRIVEIPTVVEKEVPIEVIREVPVEAVREVPVEVVREVFRDKLITEVREVLQPFGIPVPAVVKNNDTEVVEGFGETTTGVENSGVADNLVNGTTEVVEVPELGGETSNSGWLFGLMVLGAIGAVGVAFWFFFPVIVGKKKGNRK